LRHRVLAVHTASTREKCNLIETAERLPGIEIDRQGWASSRRAVELALMLKST
jgi:hypothetical protein